MLEGSRFKFDDARVPVAYDDLFVPRLFNPWAVNLLNAVAPIAGETVVDVACGPGTVARLAARRVGNTGKVIAFDISPQMLAVAKAKPPDGGATRVEYVESPAAPLKVLDGIAHVVTCQQGLQFFPDRLAAMREMRRALRAGGRLGVAVWTGIDESPFFAALHRALLRTVPKDVADLILEPFAWPDPAALQALAVEAGFRDLKVERRTMSFVLEGGVEQGVLAIDATPLAPQMAVLAPEVKSALGTAIRAELAPLVERKEVRSEMSSNLLLARA
jgi:ubiquinone/menaquinone biosynthesis C-methylase UbiE